MLASILSFRLRSVDERSLKFRFYFIAVDKKTQELTNYDATVINVNYEMKYK